MSRKPLDWKITSLAPEHERHSFFSGVPMMDRYLREQAGQDHKRGLAVVYVLTAPESLRVVGYYTLSSLSLPLGELPDAISRRLPRYPQIPTTLIGRLAVDQASRQAGQRLGEYLLMDAFSNSLIVSKQVASHLIAVDVLPIDPDPMGFYLRFGFLPLPDHPRRLILPMQTVRKSFGNED